MSFFFLEFLLPSISLKFNYLFQIPTRESTGTRGHAETSTDSVSVTDLRVGAGNDDHLVVSPCHLVPVSPCPDRV
jgi:hypothetical protein